MSPLNGGGDTKSTSWSFRLISWGCEGKRNRCRRKAGQSVVCRPIWNFNLRRLQVPGPTQFSAALKCFTNSSRHWWWDEPSTEVPGALPSPGILHMSPRRAGKKDRVIKQKMHAGTPWSSMQLNLGPRWTPAPPPHPPAKRREKPILPQPDNEAASL